MTEKEAYDKAIEIIRLVGLDMVTEHSDGSVTMQQHKPATREVSIIDIMKVIMK